MCLLPTGANGACAPFQGELSRKGCSLVKPAERRSGTATLTTRYLNRKVNGYDRQGGRVKFEIATSKDSKLAHRRLHQGQRYRHSRGPFLQGGAAQLAAIAPIAFGPEPARFPQT